MRWIERSSAVPCRSHPVLVVGGGPAGLATAIELTGHGIAAVVIERTVYDDLRIGEHLQPAAVLQLRAIDPTSKLSLDAHLASAGVEAYWGSATANHMDYFLHPGQRGLNLSRPRFDADLARACESAGATVLRSASLTHASRTSRGWEVDITVNGKARTCHVSLIVDATGRAASFSRSQGARVRAHDRQIAVVAIANDSNHQIDDSRSIVEAVEMGWWYGAPIDAARSICMLVTDDDMLPRGANSNQRAWWFEQLGSTAQLAHRFRSFQPSQRLIVRSARSQHLDIAVRNRLAGCWRRGDGFRSIGVPRHCEGAGSRKARCFEHRRVPLGRCHVPGKVGSRPPARVCLLPRHESGLLSYRDAMAPVDLLEAKERGTRKVVVTDVCQGPSP